MRAQLFLFIGVLCVVLMVLYFIWLCLRDAFRLFADRRMHRELDGLREQSEAKRRAKEEENACRLDNGCDHVFESMLGAFPPDVCEKCGLAKEIPPGECDHVWRREKGLVPASRCEKCGKTYGGVTGSHGPAVYNQ